MKGAKFLLLKLYFVTSQENGFIPFALPLPSSQAFQLVASNESKMSPILFSEVECFLYLARVDMDDFPAFTSKFHAKIQNMDQETKLVAPYRLVVTKTGPNSFHTVLNSSTEGKFDALFTDFIESFGTHFIHEAEFGAKLEYKARMKNIDTKELEDTNKNKCMQKIIQEKFEERAFRNEKNIECSNNDMKKKLQKSVYLEDVQMTVRGSRLTTGDKKDIRDWSSDPFLKADIINFKLFPILTLFDKKIMNLNRISSRFGTPVDIDGINSWMLPRYVILMNKCRNLENYIVSANGASCEKCPNDQVPSEDGYKCVCAEKYEISSAGKCRSKFFFN